MHKQPACAKVRLARYKLFLLLFARPLSPGNLEAFDTSLHGHGSPWEQLLRVKFYLVQAARNLDTNSTLHKTSSLGSPFSASTVRAHAKQLHQVLVAHLQRGRRAVKAIVVGMAAGKGCGRA